MRDVLIALLWLLGFSMALVGAVVTRDVLMILSGVGMMILHSALRSR